MIEAGFTESVTARSNKEDHRTETFFAFGRSKQLNELNSFVGQWITAHFFGVRRPAVALLLRHLLEKPAVTKRWQATALQIKSVARNNDSFSW